MGWWSMLLVMALFPVPSEAATTISAEELRNRVALHVERNHPWPAGTVRIQVLSKVADLVLPQEGVTVEVSHDPREDFIGDTYLAVKYHAGRHLVKEDTVRVGMEVLTDRVISKRELVKNREITPDDVNLQKRWLKRIDGTVATELSEVIGKTPVVNVKPNSEISKNSLRLPLLIKKGNVVRILFDSDGFSITTVGVSEEDGTMDKVIKVRNVSSNKTIYARVTGGSLVKVDF
jgi:flagella basal body P-ring formation protein FlgA